MKKSEQAKAATAAKLQRARLTAIMRLLQRIPQSSNGAHTAAPSLYPLEVTANDGSLPPPGVCKSAIDVSYTPVTVSVPPEKTISGSTMNISEALNSVLETKYGHYIRCSSGAVPIDHTFQDFQNEVYCRITEVAFATLASIVLEIVHDGYAAIDLVRAMFPDETEIHGVATDSLLTRRTRTTALLKGTSDPSEQARIESLHLHEATIVSGVDPMIAWIERLVLGQERISVTNHGQKLLNHGMTFYFAQEWNRIPWTGVPTSNGGGVIRDDCDPADDDAETPDCVKSTHLGHHLRNCYDEEDQPTQRTRFLAFCNRLDSDDGHQYAPSFEWKPLFVCQRPSGHGQTWLNTKLAGMLFMLTYTHPTGGEITLDEVQWHIERAGAASDTGDFPKATDKPIKFLFVQLLYAVVSHLDADQASLAAVSFWQEFKDWCSKANGNRQKIQLHHKVFYMWRQLICRGPTYITLRINIPMARAVILPHRPYIVDDWASRITNADLCSVFGGQEATSIADGCTKLQVLCGLHLSLGVICGLDFVESIVGTVVYIRMREAIRSSCRRATHPHTAPSTTGDIVNAAMAALCIPLTACVWRLCRTEVDDACGRPLIPGFITHPVFEIMFHEMTRLVTPKVTLSDIIEVWPPLDVPGEYRVYFADTRTIILSLVPIPIDSGYREVPNVCVSIKSASCATDVQTRVALSIPVDYVDPPAGTNPVIDENYIMQLFSNKDNHAGCISLSAAVEKRTGCSLSVEHDVMCHPFLHTPPRPETTTASKTPLLLSTLCSAGITDWEIRSDPVADWQFTIVLFAPVVAAGVASRTAIFFLVFDASDKIMKVMAARPVPTDAIFGSVDPTATLDARRSQLREYALGVPFATALQWVPASATKTVIKALPTCEEELSRWDKNRGCESKHYYSQFVEGSTNVIGLLVTLLDPSGITPDHLYEGILQWGSCFRTVFNIAFDRGDESLWSFITKKEKQLQAVSSQYAVANSGLLRLKQANAALVGARLAQCDTVEELCFFGDSNDQLELLQRRKNSLDLKRKADDSELLIDLFTKDAKLASGSEDNPRSGFNLLEHIMSTETMSDSEEQHRKECS